MAAGTNGQDLLRLTPCCLPRQCGLRRTRSPQLGTWYLQDPGAQLQVRARQRLLRPSWGCRQDIICLDSVGEVPWALDLRRGAPQEKSVELGVGEKCSIRWGLGR